MKWVEQLWGTEKRDAGITSVQLGSQSDCTWKKGPQNTSSKPPPSTTGTVKRSAGSSFSFFASFKTTTLCVGVRSCSFWVTATDNGRCRDRRVGGNNATDNRGSVISPAHWRIPHEDVISPVQSPPGTQQSADRNSAWREIKEKSRFRGGTGGIVACSGCTWVGPGRASGRSVSRCLNKAAK